jgi:hypothetical protein
MQVAKRTFHAARMGTGKVVVTELSFAKKIATNQRKSCPSKDALIRLLIEKGLLTKEEFLEMVKTVDREMNRKRIF